MLSLSRKISKVFSFFFSPLNLIWGIIFFTIRYFFFGITNANKYLESLSQPSIIPILRLYGASIGKNCDIQTGIIFHNCYNFINLKIGNNCHIGKNCLFDLQDKIEIEANVVISMKSTFITHIDMIKSEMSQQFPAKSAPIRIGQNSYIGADSCILMGVSIGQNCFVAAKSLVNKPITNNIMVGGVPAKKIKSIGKRI